jgi:hypothetical protein
VFSSSPRLGFLEEGHLRYTLDDALNAVKVKALHAALNYSHGGNIKTQLRLV